MAVESSIGTLNQSTMEALSLAGGYLFISLAGVGSGLGAGAAGSAAIGAWKRCFNQNKLPPFQLLIFAGAPLSQTIYGMILMFLVMDKLPECASHWAFFLVAGVFGGISIGVSAWLQGIAAAGACDSFADTGKGFANDLMVLGIIETVAIFVMVFGMVLISSVKP